MREHASMARLIIRASDPLLRVIERVMALSQAPVDWRPILCRRSCLFCGNYVMTVLFP
jgi:uncharacterized protein YggT (Ycf19 family)